MLRKDRSLVRENRCLLRQERCLLWRQDTWLLLRHDKCVLLRQDRYPPRIRPVPVWGSRIPIGACLYGLGRDTTAFSMRPAASRTPIQARLLFPMVWPCSVFLLILLAQFIGVSLAWKASVEITTRRENGMRHFFCKLFSRRRPKRPA